MVVDDFTKLRLEFDEYKKTGKCRCTLSQHMVGDGCVICNPAMAITQLQEQIDERDADLTEIVNVLRVLSDAVYKHDFLSCSLKNENDDAITILAKYPPVS